MLASVAASAARYTIVGQGATAADFATTPGTELEIINEAGEALCNAYPWEWLKRQAVPFSFIAGQPWVDFPSDFGEIASVVRGPGLLTWLDQVGIEEIQEYRAGANQPASSFGYYCSVENALPETLNLLNATDDLANAVEWVPTSCTQVTGVTAPNGTTQGTTLTSSATTGGVAQDIEKALLTDRRTYLLSVYLKAGTASASEVEIAQQGPGATPETSSVVPKTVVRVTWAAGVASAALQTSQGLGVHAVGAVVVNDGWYRVWAALTFDDDDAKPNAELRLTVRPGVVAFGSVLAWGAQLERYDSHIDANLIKPTRYRSQATYTPAFGEPVRRLALWPTPAEDVHGAGFLSYRRRWTVIPAETATIEIPSWMDMLYLEVVRAVARGWHEEDEASIIERLAPIWRSQEFQNATERDAGQQRSFGPMRGLAHQSRARGRDWGSGTTVPMP
jgi:hypothetical protein